MPIVLSTAAVEQSTYAITASFMDDDGAAVAPNAGTLTWTLLKVAGGAEVIVNNRSAVPIASAATVTIVLSGADLALVPGESRNRWLLIQGTYNSSLGVNLPLKEQMKFDIVNLIGVP